jgi:hypothetical protein
MTSAHLEQTEIDHFQQLLDDGLVSRPGETASPEG